MTHDTWCGVRWTFSQNFSSIALTVLDLYCFKYLEEKDQLVNNRINDEAFCRTAPATPGLLTVLQLEQLDRIAPLIAFPDANSTTTNSRLLRQDGLFVRIETASLAKLT